MPSIFEKLLKQLNINEKFTKPLKKETEFNHVKDSVALIVGNNQQMDILHLPTTRFGYKYLLTCVDLANNACDFMPLKTKTPVSVLNAYQEMNGNKYIRLAKCTLTTDSGTEFKGVFQEYLNKHNIFHRVGIPDRHKQTGNVENLNKQLGRIIMGYLNQIEEKTKVTAKNWLPIIYLIRDEINKERIIKVPKDINSYVYPCRDGTDEKGEYVKPKFKIGDSVYYKSEVPLDALGNKQNTKQFRQGDYRWNPKPKKIVKILYYPAPIVYRYMLSDMPNVSYTKNELMKE
jgi:hypothetical protein